MVPTLPLVVLGNGLFALAGGVVGVRLLLLARRTEGLPEGLLGFGFLGLVVAIPLVGIAGMGRATVAELQFELVVAGMLLLWAAAACQTAFTWLTFRPRAGWAKALVIGLAAGEACIVAGVFHAFLMAPGDVHSFAAAGSWTFWIRVPLLVNYGWTAVESLLQYRMARRRAALGLGSAVVRNRFLLFGMVGLSAAATTAVSSVLHLQGMAPTAHPLAAAVMATGGSTAAVLLYLAFMPPRAYRRFLARRAEA